MAFNIDKFISDMFGNSKTDNNTNAKKRITKKKEDGGKAKLRASQDKDNGSQRADRIAAAAKKEKTGIDKAYSRSSIASRAKKEQAAIDRAYNRSSALSTIKKDTNLAGNKKTGKKKVVVTKAQLEKSGLSLRDYMNFLKSQKTGRTISRDSRFDKKKKGAKK
jgi:hypothetical protein